MHIRNNIILVIIQSKQSAIEFNQYLLQSELEDVKKRAQNTPDDEPSGKLTSPSEIDRMRDRKNEDI